MIMAGWFVRTNNLTVGISLILAGVYVCQSKSHALNLHGQMSDQSTPHFHAHNYIIHNQTTKSSGRAPTSWSCPAAPS